MSRLRVEQLTKAYGERTLFRGFSAQLAAGDHVALVGDNGTGKSTLLGLISGEIEPSAGRTVVAAGTRITHLPQVARLEGAVSLYAALREAFGELCRIEDELRALEQRMAEEASADITARYDTLLARFEHRGGYSMDARIRGALTGVGFPADEHRRAVDTLSGGERARAALAQALVAAPDVLLLDEPTNHLDFGGLEWLEAELATFPGALVLVSHDRHMLDRVTNRTWEIADGRVTSYGVGYTASRTLREAARKRQREQFARQRAEAESYREFIRRHRAGQKHRQAKDREKKLARLEADAVDPVLDTRHIALQIPIDATSGRHVLRTDGFSVGFDSELVRVPSLLLERGERVAVIGPNGCGKTTLLRSLAGEQPLLAGSLTLGHGVHPAWFRQTQDGLFGEDTVHDVVLRRSELTSDEARHHLARFLFCGEDVRKRMADLSGGERSRVALALLSLVRGNLLLLDEPTNHLDLASQEILERALAGYDGTILLVSHDRTLLEAVTTQVWSIHDGKLDVVGRGFAAYREQETIQRVGQTARTDRASRAKRSRTASRAPGARRFAEQLLALEERIAAYEKDLDQIEKQLLVATREGDAGRIARLGAAHKEASEALNEHICTWEHLAMQEESEAEDDGAPL